MGQLEKNTPLAATPKGATEEQRRDTTTRRRPRQVADRSFVFTKDAGESSFTRDEHLGEKARGLLFAIFKSKTGLQSSRFYSTGALADWAGCNPDTIRDRLSELRSFGYAQPGTCLGKWVWRFSNTRTFPPASGRLVPAFRTSQHSEKRLANIRKKRPQHSENSLPTFGKKRGPYIVNIKETSKQYPPDGAILSDAPPINVIKITFGEGQQAMQQDLFTLPEPDLTEAEKRELARGSEPPRPKKQNRTFTLWKEINAAMRFEGVGGQAKTRSQIQIEMAQCKNMLTIWDKDGIPGVSLPALMQWAISKPWLKPHFEYSIAALTRHLTTFAKDYDEQVLKPGRDKAKAVCDSIERRKKNDAAAMEITAKHQRKKNDADRTP